eukprot:TRINITY_DN10085_c0_g1_i2.p2 TRINITY_DN10085_c0_g1~~TRINITY_DN10085_c0_g1_i2.p2  ORF type:complete len:128 (-),score=4.01 TRINITY_DN10085_c0_g1_i2:83-466(-)
MKIYTKSIISSLTAIPRNTAGESGGNVKILITSTEKTTHPATLHLYSVNSNHSSLTAKTVVCPIIKINNNTLMLRTALAMDQFKCPPIRTAASIARVVLAIILQPCFTQGDVELQSLRPKMLPEQNA